MKYKINIIVVSICFFILSSLANAAHIHEAAKNGDLDKVKLLVKKDLELLNARDNFDKTPLHWACMGVHQDVVEYLVEKGADINASDSNKVTPLHSLAIRGHIECIKLLIKKGVNIQAKDINGNQALFYAVYRGHKNVGEILLASGAEINAKNNKGLTATDLALDSEYEAVARFLIAKGGKLTPVKEAQVSCLTDNIYKITFCYDQCTNIVALAVHDSILMIDSGYRRTANHLKATIKKIFNGKIKYIINTHQHRDHIGGNIITDMNDEAKIINFMNLEQMVSDGVLKKGMDPIKGESGKIFKTYYKIYFDNREIRLIPAPGTHSPADLLIHLRGSGIVHMGDLLISQSFPSLTRGTKVFEYLDILDKVLDIFPEDTIFVGGHGRDLTKTELRDYQRMLLATAELVKEGMMAGKSVKEMQKEKLLKNYESYNHFIPELNADFWIDVVYRSYQSKNKKRLN